MTPYESWKKEKPDVSQLHTFGCIAQAKVTTPNLSKLANRSIHTVLLGYEDGSKAYRVYDPIKNKVIVSRDVVFEEDKQWDWQSVLKPMLGDNETETFTVFYPTVDEVENAEWISPKRKGDVAQQQKVFPSVKNQGLSNQ